MQTAIYTRRARFALTQRLAGSEELWWGHPLGVSRGPVVRACCLMLGLLGSVYLYPRSNEVEVRWIQPAWSSWPVGRQDLDFHVEG